MAERAPEKREIPKGIEKKIPNWMAVSHKSFEAMTTMTKGLLNRESVTFFELEPIVAYLRPGKPFEREYVRGRFEAVSKDLAAQENGRNVVAGGKLAFKTLDNVKAELKGLAAANMRAEMASGARKSVYKMWIEAVEYHKNYKTQTMSNEECEDWVVEIIALEQAYERYLQLFTEQRKDIGEEAAPK